MSHQLALPSSYPGVQLLGPHWVHFGVPTALGLEWREAWGKIRPKNFSGIDQYLIRMGSAYSRVPFLL